MRLLVALAPQINEAELASPQRAILEGPPRAMSRACIGRGTLEADTSKEAAGDAWPRLDRRGSYGMPPLRGGWTNVRPSLRIGSELRMRVTRCRLERPPPAKCASTGQRHVTERNSSSGSARIPSRPLGGPMIGRSAAPPPLLRPHRHSRHWQRRESGRRGGGGQLFLGGGPVERPLVARKRSGLGCFAGGDRAGVMPGGEGGGLRGAPGALQDTRPQACPFAPTCENSSPRSEEGDDLGSRATRPPVGQMSSVRSTVGTVRGNPPPPWARW